YCTPLSRIWLSRFLLLFWKWHLSHSLMSFSSLFTHRSFRRHRGRSMQGTPHTTSATSVVHLRSRLSIQSLHSSNPFLKGSNIH
ncbi:hypothetical protein FPV67DRAFT_1489084, partial [Lyophyllum atratum]